jgi:hypothetical protein
MTRLLGALALAFALACAPLAHAATLTATDAASAWNSYKAAVDGDIIILKGGAYGPLDLWTGSTAKVTIKVAPGEKVVATELALDGDQNLTIDACDGALDVAMTPTTQYGVSLQGNVNVTLKCVTAHQADNATMAGVPVWFRNSKATAFLNGTLSWAGIGVGIYESDGITVCGNLIHDINVDGVDIAGSHNVTICNNKVVNSHPNVLVGDHPDCFQAYNTSSISLANLKIIGNWCERGTGAASQGIFIEDGNGVDIEDNAIFGPMANGIGLARTKNGTIKHNFLQSYTVADDTGTRIIVRQEADQITILNNASPYMAIGVSNESQPTNVTPTAQQLTTLTTAAPMGDYTQYVAWRTATGAGGTPAPAIPAPAPPPAPAPAPTPAPVPTPAPTADPLQPALDAATAQIAALQAQLAAAPAKATVDAQTAQITGLKAKITKAQTALNAFPSNTAKQLQTKIANALAALK